MGEGSSSSLFSGKKEVKRSVLCLRETESKENGALGLNLLGQPALQQAKQQCRLPQQAAQTLSDPLHSLSNGPHQINEQVAKSYNRPTVHAHALLPISFLNG